MQENFLNQYQLRAIHLLNEIRIRPQMYFNVREAFLCQISGIVSVILPEFDGGYKFFAKYLGTRGNYYRDIDLPLEDVWAQQVIDDALFEIKKDAIFQFMKNGFTKNKLKIFWLSQFEAENYISLSDVQKCFEKLVVEKKIKPIVDVYCSAGHRVWSDYGFEAPSLIPCNLCTFPEENEYYSEIRAELVVEEKDGI